MLVHIYIYIVVVVLSSLLLSLLLSLLFLYVTLTMINYMRTILCHTDVSLLGEVGRSSAQGRVGVQGPVTPGRTGQAVLVKPRLRMVKMRQKVFQKNICDIYIYIYIIYILCILDVIYALCIRHWMLFYNRLHFFVVLLLIQKPLWTITYQGGSLIDCRKKRRMLSV